MKIAMMAVLFVASIAQAHVPLENFQTKPILADLKDLRALNIPVMSKDEYAQVGYAVVTPESQQRLQEYSHANGKCGGFEDLSQEKAISVQGFAGMIASLSQHLKKDALYERAPFRAMDVGQNKALASAIDEIKVENMQATVAWLSSYGTRFNRASNPNVHVNDLKKKLEDMLASSSIPHEVTLIDHQSTNQKSVRVRLTGSEKPNEIVVLGAHLDSINMSWSGGDKAPGADDNA